MIVNPGAVLREPQPRAESPEVRRGRSSIEGKADLANQPKVRSPHFPALTAAGVISSERPSSTTPQPEPAQPQLDEAKPMEVDGEGEGQEEVVADSQQAQPAALDGGDEMEVDQPAPTEAPHEQDKPQPDSITVDSDSGSTSPKETEAPPASQPRVPFSFAPSQRPPGEADPVEAVGDKLDAVDLDPKQDKGPSPSPDQNGFDPDK